MIYDVDPGRSITYACFDCSKKYGVCIDHKVILGTYSEAKWNRVFRFLERHENCGISQETTNLLEQMDSTYDQDASKTFENAPG